MYLSGYPPSLHGHPHTAKHTYNKIFNFLKCLYLFINLALGLQTWLHLQNLTVKFWYLHYSFFINTHTHTQNPVIDAATLP